MVSLMEMGLAVNAVAKGVMWLINALNEGIGNYGVAVICFTLILKLCMSPFDVWQKVVMTKNNRAMERMKPQLEKLQKQYAGNRELYSQKQMELYKKEHYSMLGSCLPSIISLVIFFLVFSGFNGMIKQYNLDMFNSMKSTYVEVEASTRSAKETELYQVVYDETYNTFYQAELEAGVEDSVAQANALTEVSNVVTNRSKSAATEAAQAAVLEKFENDYKKQVKFMWIQNVFMPDSWKSPIPEYETFIGSGIGKLGINSAEINQSDYNMVMEPLIETYNNVKRNGKDGGRWNGFMILPILTGLITFASTKLMKQTQPPQMPNPNGGQGQDMQNAMQSNMKMMQWFMPIMLAVFALLYSTAFTVYMVISNLFSTVFQFIYNAVVKVHDKRNEDNRLSTTFK